MNDDLRKLKIDHTGLYIDGRLAIPGNIIRSSQFTIEQNPHGISTVELALCGLGQIEVGELLPPQPPLKSAPRIP